MTTCRQRLLRGRDEIPDSINKWVTLIDKNEPGWTPFPPGRTPRRQDIRVICKQIQRRRINRSIRRWRISQIQLAERNDFIGLIYRITFRYTKNDRLYVMTVETRSLDIPLPCKICDQWCKNGPYAIARHLWRNGANQMQMKVEMGLFRRALRRDHLCEIDT